MLIAESLPFSLTCILIKTGVGSMWSEGWVSRNAVTGGAGFFCEVYVINIMSMRDVNKSDIF